MEKTMQQRRQKNWVSSREADLIRSAKQNPAAFGELYDHYAGSVYRYILSRTANIDLAQDITSQTFLKVIEMLPRYQHRGYFSAWLFTIARNQMADYYRAHAREEKILPQLQTDSLSDTLSIVVRNERLRELSHLLSSLKEEELDLLRLRNIAELSFAELSQVFSKSEEAVKKSYYRLLTRLQSRLEESNAI